MYYSVIDTAIRNVGITLKAFSQSRLRTGISESIFEREKIYMYIHTFIVPVLTAATLSSNTGLNYSLINDIRYAAYCHPHLLNILFF